MYWNIGRCQTDKADILNGRLIAMCEISFASVAGISTRPFDSYNNNMTSANVERVATGHGFKCTRGIVRALICFQACI